MAALRQVLLHNFIRGKSRQTGGEVEGLGGRGGGGGKPLFLLCPMLVHHPVQTAAAGGLSLWLTWGLSPCSPSPSFRQLRRKGGFRGTCSIWRRVGSRVAL